MNKRITTLLALLTLALWCAPCTGETDTEWKQSQLEQKILAAFPPSPPGFQWVLFQGVALRVPTTWNIFSKDNTFCSSVESIPERGSFETGATIQVLQNVQERAKYPASVIALDMIQKLDDLKQTTRLFLKTNKKMDENTILYKYRNAPVAGKPVIVHKYVHYSDKESFINIVTFEAPEDKYDAYWEYQGKTIFDVIIPISTLIMLTGERRPEDGVHGKEHGWVEAGDKANM